MIHRYTSIEWRQARKHHRNQQKKFLAKEFLQKIQDSLSTASTKNNLKENQLLSSHASSNTTFFC